MSAMDLISLDLDPDNPDLTDSMNYCWKGRSNMADLRELQAKWDGTSAVKTYQAIDYIRNECDQAHDELSTKQFEIERRSDDPGTSCGVMEYRQYTEQVVELAQWNNLISKDGKTFIAFWNARLGQAAPHWSTAAMGSLAVYHERHRSPCTRVDDTLNLGAAAWHHVERIIRHGIEADDWKGVTNGIVRRRGSSDELDPNTWIKIEPDPAGDVSFHALLATTHGAGVIHLLKDHPDVFGRDATISAIYINLHKKDMHLEISKGNPERNSKDVEM